MMMLFYFGFYLSQYTWSEEKLYVLCALSTKERTKCTNTLLFSSFALQVGGKKLLWVCPKHYVE